MAENTIETKQKKEPEKQAENDQMSEVLWWFSTAIKELIQDCTVDRNRYKILGSAMLFTWLYATLAWGYFWSTNSDSPFLFISLGIFMGGFVLSIDRVLVSSINKKRTNIAAIGLRVIMALCIGAFLAQPIILFIFSSDIDREIPILLDKKLAEKKIEVEQVYQSRKDELLANKKKLEEELKQKSDLAIEKQSDYLKEIDGTGGSGKFGIAGIAKAKQNGYMIAKNDLDKMEKDSKTELEKITKELDEINTKVTKSVSDFEKTLDGKGFLIKKEALQSLFDKDKTHGLQNQYYLLMVILTLFELIPIISKLFMPAGAYDTKVALRDDFETKVATLESEKEFGEKERELA
ncbi:DUF4407 domain-containing protein [Fluviicola sp.]|uniref:DUF4407 domain-containing protein n=1 Tax=Fluviicola sp. TaxID=1917219 RepID=UPI003D277E28